MVTPHSQVTPLCYSSTRSFLWKEHSPFKWQVSLSCERHSFHFCSHRVGPCQTGQWESHTVPIPGPSHSFPSPCFLWPPLSAVLQLTRPSYTSRQKQTTTNSGEGAPISNLSENLTVWAPGQCLPWSNPRRPRVVRPHTCLLSKACGQSRSQKEGRFNGK